MIHTTMRHPRIVLALALSACGDGGSSFDYPLDGVLRMNHVQAKGTHNSYHLDPGLGFEPWAYTHLPIEDQLERQGIRQLELDVYWFDYDGDPRLEVFHAPLDARSNCPRLEDCLSRVARWSEAHPAHHPILVLLEPKDEFDPALGEKVVAKMEQDISARFPRARLVTPELVQGDAPSLREAIVTRGWPTLGEVRGRVMFALLDSGPYRDVLTRGGQGLAGRLIFAIGGRDQPWASVLLVDDAIVDEAGIRDAVTQGFLVRSRADVDGVEARSGDRTRLEAALRSGAHAVSTDFPDPFPATGYGVEMPGGAPTRCNPVTAPPDCSPEAIEDPSFLD
jgi:hypothetical protein